MKPPTKQQIRITRKLRAALEEAIIALQTVETNYLCLAVQDDCEQVRRGATLMAETTRQAKSMIEGLIRPRPITQE